MKAQDPPVDPGAPPSRQDRSLGKQLLFYRPEGPLGGTFSCAACAAQGWQPELIEHRPDCPYRPAHEGEARDVT